MDKEQKPTGMKFFDAVISPSWALGLSGLLWLNLMLWIKSCDCSLTDLMESSHCCWEEGFRLLGPATFAADVNWVAEATACFAAFSSLLINFFFSALLAAALVATRKSSAALFNFSCSVLSLGFLAAPYNISKFIRTLNVHGPYCTIMHEQTKIFSHNNYMLNLSSFLAFVIIVRILTFACKY